MFPSVNYSVVEDSNPYVQDDDRAEQATVTRIKPEFELNLDSGKGLYSLTYWLEQGAYSTNANDNYTDQSLELEGVRSFGRRLEGASSFLYKLGHDPRGAGVDEGIVALEDVFYPDEFRELSFDASLKLGAEASTLGFQGYVNALDRNYLNNFERGTADREYQDKTLGLISFIYVSPITDVLFEARRSRIDYQSPNEVAQEKEGSIQTYFLGAEWEVSGKTSGSVKLGKMKRYFDSENIKANDSFSWEVSLEWAPRTYSEVTLETSRGSKETSGPGVFVLSSDTAVGWLHKYSVFFATDVSILYSFDEYFDDSRVQRKDNTMSVGCNFIYSPSKSMDLGLSYTLENRDSDTEGLDYNRDVLGLELSLAI